MNFRSLTYKIIGYLSIAVGVAATLCIFRIQYVYFGIMLSIIGFILSGINIFLNTRYYHEEEKYPKGYLGMVFSSLPVLFMLFVILKHKQ
jgi:uncharacterized membrane protein